jgi:hypothetical protein
VEAGFVLADGGIDFVESALKVVVAHHGWARDADQVGFVFLDDPVEVKINKILSGLRAPVAE